MYAWGYSNQAMATSLLKETGISADPCSDCGKCTVECVKNFRVREKIADIPGLANLAEECTSQSINIPVRDLT
jgi:hypothetical protein